MEDRVAVLDGQQRLTALNIGLRGSYASKTKWRRFGRPQSYPKRHLYLDLRAEPRLSEDRYEDQAYRFEFLEPERAETDNQGKDTYWYRCSEILRLPRDAAAGVAINEFLRKMSLADHPHAFDTLFKLWSAIFQQRHLSYFTEKAQSLDRVLDIFIRVNNQGQPLSKSDLLMSIATAQWKERDAREEIPATVREVNAVHPGFGFDRDHILKAGLVLASVSDVGFRAETFNRDNTRLSQFYAVAISARLVPGSGAGVEDEGLVDPLFRCPGRACEGAGELVFAVLAGAGLVDPDGPVVGGALVAQAQDRGGLAVPGQQRGDVAVLPAVADEGLAEAGPAGRHMGDDPPGDGVPGLLVWRLRHAVHDGRRGRRRPCPPPVMK